MAWIPAAISAVGAIGSAVASNSNSGGSSGSASQSSQVSPAGWGTLGENAGDLWDSFVGKMFGGITDESMTNARLSPERTARFWELKNEQDRLKRDIDYKRNIGDGSRIDLMEMENKQDRVDYLEGLLRYEFPDVYTPSLEEMMQTNYQSQEDTGLRYLNDMNMAGTALKSSTAANTGQYQGSLDKIGGDASTPFMKFAIGGQPVNAISKRQLMLADVLSGLAEDKYKSGGIMNQTNYDVDTGAADRRMNQGMQFTPYGADMQYMDRLWPIISQLQGYRFQTPSTVETGTANTGLSFAEKMAALSKGTSVARDLWSMFNAPAQSSGVPTVDTNFTTSQFLNSGIYD